MKCDELKRKYSDITGPYYGYNEVNEAIAELKKKLMPCLNGDCILTCEVVEKYGKENAELKADNERLRGESCKLTDGCLRLKQCRKEKANIADELRHSNRKRCLAMANWCDSEMNYWYDRIMLEQCPRFKFYEKWRKRWLALAEEPTWVKFLQLIHKEEK